MRVLVSGGAGYIGSVTSEVLLQAGHEVTVLDSLVHGHRRAVPTRVLHFHVHLGDLGLVRDTIQRQRPEAILHFAGNIEVGESMRDPFKYLGDNVHYGHNLFRAAVEGGVRKIILSSTANLFDQPERIPIDETATIRPGSPYGESKLILERTLAWLEKTHGVRFAALRYFNAAGATAERGEHHSPETHLIPLILQVAQGKRPNISIFGTDWDTPDGTCIRDYIHVADLAQAHVLALQALDGGSRTYNLGNGTGFSVKQVIQAAERVTGRPIATVAAPRRAGDPARLVADSTRIRKELGWTPLIPEIDRIVESAWKWMKKYPDGYPV